MLDTNALSAWAEGQAGIRGHLTRCRELVVPVVVLGEYYYGIRRSTYRKRYEAWLAKNIPTVKVAMVNHGTAKVYVSLRLAMHSAGTPMSANDLWIASLAVQHGFPLLSNDTDFDSVDGLERIGF